MTEAGLLVRGAEINGEAALDCRIHDGRIAEIGRALRPASHELTLNAGGGALIPGLADHHIHLTALAAWRASLDLTDVPASRLADTLRTAAPDAAGWVRAVGYDDLSHGELDRERIDTWQPDMPIRVQHRSGGLWVLNSAALDLVAAETASHPGIERDPTGRATGRIWRADDLLRARIPNPRPSLRSIGHELAGYGITHLSDATPDSDGTVTRLLTDAVDSGDIPQHVAIMGTAPPHSPRPRLTTGPVKLIVDDHQPPDLDDLAERVRAAHASGRPVAVHCITRQALALTLAALDKAGGRNGDRIEHGAVTDLATAGLLAERRIRVVTQPTLVARRGDSYLRHVDEADLPDLWRYGSLLAAGVSVVPSSDAPYGDPDPWTGLRAAASRHTPSGHVLGEGERVPVDVALTGMQSTLDDPGGPSRLVRPGAPADLALLEVPLADALHDPDASRVRATVINGHIAWERGA